MLDAVFETPRLSLNRLLIASVVFIIFSFLGFLKFGVLFGMSIWPLPMVWILNSVQKSPPDYRLIIWIFILGLFQDIIFGSEFGIFGASALIALVLLWLFHRFAPIVPSSATYQAILSCLAYIGGLMVFGLMIGNIPNLLGLIIPSVLAIALSPFLIKFFDLEKGTNNER